MHPRPQVLTFQDVLADEHLTPEQRALIEYELGLHAQKFIGHSFNTLSALLLLVRTGWSSYYNYQDDIPLAQYVPFFPVPWVFTYTTRGGSYDYQVKMAVTSALRMGTLVPYCVYEGSPDTALHR